MRSHRGPHRPVRDPSVTQTGLEFEPIEPLPLREAFDQAGYAQRGITFAQATSGDKQFRHLTLCLRLRAEAILKERKEA